MLKLYRESVSFRHDGSTDRFSMVADGIEVDGVIYAKTSYGDLQKVGGSSGVEWYTTLEAAKAACAEKLRKIAAAVITEIAKLEATT